MKLGAPFQLHGLTGYGCPMESKVGFQGGGSYANGLGAKHRMLPAPSLLAFGAWQASIMLYI